MKKSNMIILAAVCVLVIISVAGAALISGMLGSIFNSTEPPQIKDASIATSFGGGYDLEAGAYELEANAQNIGQKDAKNVRVDITFLNADTGQELKTQTITFGDIAADSSKDINLSIAFPSDSVRVTFSTTDPIWE
jgi:hypothetical protein